MRRTIKKDKYSRKSSKIVDDVGLVIIIMSAVNFWHYMAIFSHWFYYPLLVAVVIGVLEAMYRCCRSMKTSFKRRSMAGVDGMTGLDFEHHVARLLEQKGFSKVRLTEKYDLGVDIIAYKDGIRWGIQIKRYSGLVKAEAVRQVVTALNHYGCDRAMVITNSSYSHTAEQLAKTNNCLLIDRKLLMKEYL